MQKVLLAGDSISSTGMGGYAPVVARLLPGFEVKILRQILGYYGNTTLWLDPEALNHYCQVCYGHSAEHAKQLIKRSIPFEELMVDPGYDVIHLNSGLHDIQGAWNAEKAVYEPIVPAAMYEENLERIVTRILGETASRLIWASTTPVIDQAGRKPVRYEKDVQKYNEVAEKVMQRHNVPINDLHELVAKTGISKCLEQDGVHLSTFGSEALGKAVADAVAELAGGD